MSSPLLIFSLFPLHRLNTSLLLGMLYLWWFGWTSCMPGHKVTQLILLQTGAALKHITTAGRMRTHEADTSPGPSSPAFHMFHASSCHLHWAKTSIKNLVISYKEKYFDSLLILKCNIWRAERKEIAVLVTFVLSLQPLFCSCCFCEGIRKALYRGWGALLSAFPSPWCTDDG